MYYIADENIFLIAENEKAFKDYPQEVKFVDCTVEEFKDGKYIREGNEVVINPNYEEEKQAEEKARIQELYMTRSDFFDGTIRAFGLDDEGLLQIIIAYFAGSNDYDELQEKIAINNFKNALNFYRKYPLFNMLSGVPLPISETETITISALQWDNFFNETDKKNPEAYKELLAITLKAEEVLPAIEETPAEEETE